MEINYNNVYTKVFGWLGIGLLLTFAVAFGVSTNVDRVAILGFSTISIIAELVIALVMGFCLHKLSPTACTILYLVYCILSGLNFSVIFLAYKVTSIIYVFLITSAIFGLFAFLGKVAKVDFRKLGIYLLFTLLAIIIASIVNIFIGSSQLEFILTIVCIAVFMLYILYDMKIIPNLIEVFGSEKAAIYGAFQLYVDFINLFIDILRLVGKSKD